MLIVSYDISNDKLRAKFSKFLSKFGHRLQYSVFEIDNSERFLSIVSAEIKSKFEKTFTDEDSIMVFKMSNTCEIIRYGYAKHDEEDLIIV